MNHVLIMYLSMSLSGSLLILILFSVKSLFKDKINKQWQYYIWLIVIARLLFPFASEINLTKTIFQSITPMIIQTDTIQSQQQEQSKLQDNESLFNTQQDPFYNWPIQSPLSLLQNNLWLLWCLIALLLLVRKITIYQSFVRYIKAGQIPIGDTDLLDRMAVIGEQAGVKRPIELYSNPLISSPLLIGFFHSSIILPSMDISERDFHYTVLHEMTHYRRRDMFYKWLVQITVCIHWFNPLAYLMLPYMTPNGISQVKKVYSQKNENLYNASSIDADNLALTILDHAKSWDCLGILWPYLSQEMKETCRQKAQSTGTPIDANTITQWNKTPNDGDTIFTTKDIDLGVAYYQDTFGWVSGLEYFIPFTSHENSAISKPFFDKNNSNDADERGICIMENSGTWGETIEQLLPSMSSEAIEEIIIIYVDRHIFPGISTAEDIKKAEQTIQTAYPYMTETSVYNVQQYMITVKQKH